jgi:glyoxylase-like metal-dependent hydrolase (beta-lactamase superfamily II)
LSVKIETLRFGFFNCYLLTGENGSILVDTVKPKSRGQLLAKIKDKNIRLILLTHGHLDHVGNAGYLADKLGVPVAMSESDFPIINSTKPELNTDVFVAKVIRIFLKLEAKRNKVEAFDPVFIKEGDSLIDYGVDAKIIALPGHTRGSIGVLLASGDFISGDATMNAFYVDKAEMMASANKILSMDVRKIYPGHGKVQTLADVAKEFRLK